MSFKNYVSTYEFLVTLPSGEGEIKCQPIKFKQMKHLLTISSQAINVVEIENGLDFVLQGSIIGDFNIDSLYLQDRLYILTELRKKSKGTIQQKQIICEKCKSQFIYNIDLDKIHVKKLPEKLNKIIKLNENISVEVDFPRRKNQKDLYEYLELLEKDLQTKIEETPDDKDLQMRIKYFDKFKELEASEFLVISSIVAIISPDGREDNLSFEDRKFLIDSLAEEELTKIGNWLDDNNFGLAGEIKTKCKFCKHETKFSVGLHDFF